jgi:hypothetical protein
VIVKFTEGVIQKFKLKPSKALLETVRTLSAALERAAAVVEKASLACTFRCLGCALKDVRYGKVTREFQCMDECAFNVMKFMTC